MPINVDPKKFYAAEWEGEGIEKDDDSAFVEEALKVLESRRNTKRNAVILKKWLPKMFQQGGAGSGHRGHGGRPGKRGGSAPKSAGVFKMPKSKKGFTVVKDKDPTPISDDNKKYMSKKRKDADSMGRMYDSLLKQGSFYSSIAGGSPSNVDKLQTVGKARLNVPADRMSKDLISEYTSQYYELANQHGHYIHGWIDNGRAYLEIVREPMTRVNSILRSWFSSVKQQGGAGSGFEGHRGRPGKRGGSLPRSGGAGGSVDESISKGKPGVKEYEVREQDKETADSYLYGDAAKPVLERYNLTPEQAKAEIDKAREAAAKLPSTKDIHTDKDGNYTPERQKLHKSIVDEFLSKGESSDNPTILLTGGLPGSGKSTMLENDVYKDYASGFVTVDSDAIKGMLAKADGLDKVTIEASAYHEESSDVLADVLRGAVPKNMNIIYDSTMRSQDKTERLISGFIDAGYNVEIAFSDLPPEQAMSRAVGRYLGGGRFVDPNYIATHDHMNPKTADYLKQYASTYRKWDNNVPFGEPPKLIEELIK